ncbi:MULTISPECIES: hypothetical protein [unclassified Modestobacter]|uniref:hypothetical protein n=1 Tax=unclassified Modestobacter TaxID=2643866 RepID=UPI0022AAA63D|nr:MULTISPECIES: hypothetical protein [unclassified Modestobacter]MCZ2824865.1 hypothetical protein [Modestobacter sp. VKM Ac-2981]MCZ2854632.1 hypothetical protein [Modestobacter sp. VKM Ac-2982]
MLETDDHAPTTALLAGLAGGVSAVPLLFTALITYSCPPDLDPVERWSWPVLLALAVGHLVGAARLTRRRATGCWCGSRWPPWSAARCWWW